MLLFLLGSFEPYMKSYSILIVSLLCSGHWSGEEIDHQGASRHRHKRHKQTWSQERVQRMEILHPVDQGRLPGGSSFEKGLREQIIIDMWEGEWETLFFQAEEQPEPRHRCPKCV